MYYKINFSQWRLLMPQKIFHKTLHQNPLKSGYLWTFLSITCQDPPSSWIIPWVRLDGKIVGCDILSKK